MARVRNARLDLGDGRAYVCKPCRAGVETPKSLVLSCSAHLGNVFRCLHIYNRMFRFFVFFVRVARVVFFAGAAAVCVDSDTR